MAVVGNSKRLKTETGLQLNKMFSPGLFPACVIVPFASIDTGLIGRKLQQRWCGIICRWHDVARMTHVAKLHGESQSIMIATMLPNNRKLLFTKCVEANQF